MAIKRLVVPSAKAQETPAPASAVQPTPAPRVASKWELTPEQDRICASKAGVIKVSAFAGTGKTTTLCAFSEVNPESRILYIAFNKAIQLEASGKFPDHVTARTAHSIAFGACGRDYANKLAADIRPFHIQRHLERSLRDIPGPAHNLYGARVIETVKNYLVSGDMVLGSDHVSVGNAPVAEYAEAVNDREIISRCKLVGKYGHDIPRLIERIEQSALPPIVPGDTASMRDDEKRIILTTAHKSKGLEFKNVKLAGDFMPLIDDEGKVFDVAKASPSDIEDVNIQYVAVTRAMKALHLCESLEQYLEYVNEHVDRAAQCP